MMRRFLCWTCILIFAYGCGSKQAADKDKKKSAKGPDIKDCRALRNRNLECLEVLVPMAQRNSRRLMEKALKDVAEPERSQLRARLREAMESQKSGLKQTLAEGLKGPFMKWCASAHRSDTQAQTLKLLKACLTRTDCQGYAECLGQIMEKTASDLIPRKPQTPQPQSPARKTSADGSTS